MSSLSATEPSTTALALPPTQYANGLATEHSNSSDMDSEVVVSVIPGDQQQKAMVIHCDDERSKLYSSAQADFEKFMGAVLQILTLM